MSACCWVWMAALALGATACGGGDDDDGTQDTAPMDSAADSAGDTADAADDTAAADTGQTAAVYGPVDPPAGPVAEVLRGDRWVTHFEGDLRPYWITTEAKGSPVGNFPTFRGMDGGIVGSAKRRPRMIARQVFTYSAGYLMTGDEALLELAAAGVKWLRDHAIDRVNGGCHEQLEANGDPVAGVRTAQDLSYCMLGLAAYYFVTRDAGAEADLIQARGWLFDSARYWDSANGRIKDALNDAMTQEVDVEGDGGWELVAQLDPVNAFMLLVQPVLSSASDRDTFLGDLRTLGQVLVDEFHRDGIFWGVHNKKGQYGSKHVDFGHTLKSYWMLLQIDKRLPDHPFHDLVADNVHGLIERAFDDANGRWAKRPSSATAVEFGSDWWGYAEADQIAATLNLQDYRYSDELAQTAGNWLTDYVDTDYPVREVIPSIRRDGSRVWSWNVNDDAKCNRWKNGFHSAEHALVFALLGAHLERKDATLHFAVPAAMAQDFAAVPYVFNGTEVGRTSGDSVTIGGASLTEVEVRFRNLY